MPDLPDSKAKRAGGLLPNLTELANKMLASEEDVERCVVELRFAEEHLERAKSEAKERRSHFELAVEAFGYKPLTRDEKKVSMHSGNAKKA